MFLSFDSDFFDYFSEHVCLSRLALSLWSYHICTLLIKKRHCVKKAKRQNVRKSENPKIEIDTALYITEIIILFHATFQWSDNHCTLIYTKIRFQTKFQDEKGRQEPFIFHNHCTLLHLKTFCPVIIYWLIKLLCVLKPFRV